MGTVMVIGALLLIVGRSLHRTEAPRRSLNYTQFLRSLSPQEKIEAPSNKKQIPAFFTTKAQDAPIIRDHSTAQTRDVDNEKLASSEVSAISRRLPTKNAKIIMHRPSSEREPMVMEPGFSSSSGKIGLRWERLALVQSGSAGLALFGFSRFDKYFGSVAQPFRIGNDWMKDRTLHFDELLHFQGSYRITQGLIGLYRWCGLDSPWAEGIGAGTAATVMTFLEYLDGRRPKDQASYSDFLANFLGVGFALAKERIAVLQDFDLQFSYQNPTDIFQRQTLLKYDRMTHWLTYSLRRQWHLPLHLGLGYGIRNAFKKNVQSEIYLGIGLTPVDLLQRYYPAAAKPLAWMGIYHLGWQVQIR